MPTLVLADIHGNLPALEAVLAHPAAQRCADIVSLGDHVNFGPQSRQVHDRLASLGALMLLGNHEERLTHPEDAAFDGYNWRLMRWTARQMRDIDLRLPTDVRRDSVLFTHGTPGAPYHLVQTAGVPAVLDALPPKVTLLLTGHNHSPWNVVHGGRRGVNPGSCGMFEFSPGMPAHPARDVAMAPFLVLDGGEVTLHHAGYDTRAVAHAFLSSGASRIAPELCRVTYHVMRTAEPQATLKLIRHVSAVAAGMGLSLADESAWKAADLTYLWTEPVPSEEYWLQMEKSL